MAFSASEAAFEGFRVLRREPKTALVWAAFQLVTTVVAMLIMQPFLNRLSAALITPGTTPTPAEAMAFMSEAGRFYLMAVPVYLIIGAVFTAAVYRAALRPEDKGFGRLELGGDELKLVGLYVLMIAVFFVVGLAVTIVGSTIGVGVAMALKATAAASVIVIGVVYLAMLIVLLWVWVRLSFAAPLTFTQGRINLFASWALTKGRFWPLFGCYLLALIFVLLIFLVYGSVLGVLAIGMNGGSLTRAASVMMRPDYSSYASLFTPLFVVRLVIGAVVTMVASTIMIAAPAAAYREIVAPRPQDQADTFA